VPDPTADPDKVLDDLEKVWKEALKKRKEGQESEPERPKKPEGPVNPRLDPTKPLAVGMDEQGQPNLVLAPDVEPSIDWDAVRASAIELLAVFVDPAQARDRQVTAIDLVPTRKDFEDIFQPERVDDVEAAYRRAFPTPPMPVARPDQTRIVLATARPDQLAERTPFSEHFPGAYRRIVDRLMPEPVWAAWKFVAPGSPHGMLYDGLVWTEGRWVWIPKPWRLFPDLA